jgi:hypothetical protein
VRRRDACTGAPHHAHAARSARTHKMPDQPVFDTSVAAALCPGRAPPSVAVCIAGGPRALAKRQVHTSIRRHLVEAFGGEPTVFWHLNLFDPIDGHFSSESLTEARETLRPAMQRLNADDGAEFMRSKGHKPNLGCFNNADMSRLFRHVRVMAELSSMEGYFSLCRSMAGCRSPRPLTVTVTVIKPPRRQPTPNAVGPALGLRQTTGVGLIFPSTTPNSTHLRFAWEGASIWWIASSGARVCALTGCYGRG